MCGIFGYVGSKRNAPEIILAGLKLLEYRGYDSWGICVNKDGKISIDKHTGKIGNATVNLPPSFIGCGHTRWATHGGVTDINAHPHKDCTGSIAVLHNGIVENYLELKKELIQKKHTFISQTDTEIIAHLIEESMRTTLSPLEAVRKAFHLLEGRNAVIALFAQANMIVVVKNGSPIVLGYGKNERFLASDAPAILPHTKRVVFLEDNQIATLDSKDTTIYDAASGKKVTPRIHTLTWKVEQAEKGDYPHFLLKEIMEQGRTLADVVNQDKSVIEKLASAIKDSFGTYVVGCGTAGHACRAATYIFSLIAKKHANFCVGSEFSYFEHFLTKDSLLIAASQSGETADTLEAVQAARRHGAKVAALVNALGSTLEREADMTVYLKAGPEKAVLSTKAFSAKLAVFYLLAYTLIGKYEQGRNHLLQTADDVQHMLGDTTLHDTLRSIANKISKKNDLYILGRGISFPIALEAAHKIKEASYIHAEGFAGGEPKHCEISLIEKGTPTLVFVPKDETERAILSNAMEFKSRGALIIGISPTRHDVFDHWIQVPDAGITSSILHVIPAQLLAYYLALQRGTDPDKPRNLAKSVTVK